MTTSLLGAEYTGRVRQWISRCLRGNLSQLRVANDKAKCKMLFGAPMVLQWALGDEQRPLEASDEAEEMKVSLHSTPRPLPDAIKKMPRSATMCRYCGVSYLIYNEFHRLNTRIAQLEAVLHEARESALKEKAQREALELDMQEWKRALQRQAEQKEMHMREEFEERSRQLKQAMTKECVDKLEKDRLMREEDVQKINNEMKQQFQREMETIEFHKVATQKAELEARSAEREKVLNDTLQKVNKRLEDCREYREQLEQRLTEAVATKKEVEQQFEEEKKQRANLRFKHQQQLKVVQRSLWLLRSFGRDLTDVRGFLITLAGAWQTFSRQLQQQSAQVLSGIRDSFAHSAGELQKMALEKERLTLQLMEQMNHSEGQLALHKNSEMDYKATVRRVKSELEMTHVELLSSQQRCDTLQEQLSTWQRRLEQISGTYRGAEGEATRLRVALESAKRDARDVHRDRDVLTDSYRRALDKLKDDYQCKLALKLSEALEEQRSEHAAQLREQMSEVLRETSLELSIHTEKNRTLLLQYQRDSARLQQKLAERDEQVEGLQIKLEEERKSEKHQSRKQEEKVQEERDMWRQQLLQAQTEVQTMTESNRLLQREVAILEETVKRECEEREELTAALSRTQEQLVGLHSVCSLSSPRHTSTSKTISGEGQTRVPLSRSCTPPNRFSPHAGRVQGRGPGAATSRDRGEEEKDRKGSLPRIRANGMDAVTHKIGLVMRLNERDGKQE
ncbi:uncharacterized protein lekr1 [Eucyclogobius newberryi]|uniref:uncharacterized protein lekr1 n=1 Tax=Eucyclogobius newberryi TaxID=166745 RepID=UPI003B5B2CBC